MNQPYSEKRSIDVYLEIRQIESTRCFLKSKKTVLIDILKTIIASAVGALIFPLGIVLFFYFLENKNKYYATVILLFTVGFSNILTTVIRVFMLIIEALKYSGHL